MQAPADLSVRSGDGKEQFVVRGGGALPARTKLVFATSKPGQAEILLEVVEGSQRLVGRASFELPRGLPANCWIPVEISVDASLRVRAEARENLRRIRVDGRFDTSAAEAEHYSA